MHLPTFTQKKVVREEILNHILIIYLSLSI
jgi:hypothetical protein